MRCLVIDCDMILLWLKEWKYSKLLEKEERTETSTNLIYCSCDADRECLSAVLQFRYLSYIHIYMRHIY